MVKILTRRIDLGRLGTLLPSTSRSGHVKGDCLVEKKKGTRAETGAAAGPPIPLAIGAGNGSSDATRSICGSYDLLVKCTRSEYQ